MTRWKHWLATLLVGGLGALVVWGAIQVGSHLLQDHADQHLMLDLLKYNILQGRLVQLPGAGAVPPAAPAPEPKK